MRRLTFPLVMIAVVGVGLWYVLRSETGPTAVGSETAPAPALSGDVVATPIGEISGEMAGEEVRIEGVITRMCVHTGCWAVVQDDTGLIRIDTRPGGFALPLHREGRPITVDGTVTVKENGDVELAASWAEVR